MTRLLQGRTVLITGAGSNVGRAASALFAEHGAKLALADIDPARVPDEPLVIAADLTDSQACRRMAERASAELGGIDVLCNTAGIEPPGATTATETSDADWERILAVNLGGVFRSCRVVLPVMLAAGAGA